MAYRDSDALLQTALENALQIPVRRILYRGDNAPALAVYQCTQSEPMHWSDGIRGLGEDYDDQTQMYHAQMECNYTEDID